MTFTVKTENSIIENYLYLIVIKLALILAFKVTKSIVSIHTKYRKGIKRKYASRDIEANKPIPATRQSTST